MKINKIVLLALAFSVFLVSCRKDKSEPPVITFLESFQTTPYHIGDSIHVKVNIHDDRNITGLTVSLVNSGHTPVLPVQTFASNKADINVDFNYLISNKEIQTGNYNILVFATDGESDTRAYAGVFVQEMPRFLTRVYFAVYKDPASKSIFTADPDSVPVFLMDVPGDFSGAALSTRHEKYYISGKYSGDLLAISTKDHIINWSIQGIPQGGAPYFTGMASDKDLIYTGYYHYSISGYNHLMNQQFQTLTDLNSFPSLILPNENYFVAIEEYYFGGNKNLLVYNNPAGNILHVTPVVMNATALLKKNSHEIYLTGNETGKGKIYIGDLLTGNLFLRHELTNDTLTGSTMINEDCLLLSSPQGLWEFNNNSNNLIPLVSGQGYMKVFYEDASNEVYAINGNQFYRYGYLTHQLILLQNGTLPDSILHIDFLYNREKF